MIEVVTAKCVYRQPSRTSETSGSGYEVEEEGASYGACIPFSQGAIGRQYHDPHAVMESSPHREECEDGRHLNLAARIDSISERKRELDQQVGCLLILRLACISFSSTRCEAIRRESFVCPCSWRNCFSVLISLSHAANSPHKLVSVCVLCEIETENAPMQRGQRPLTS